MRRLMIFLAVIMGLLTWAALPGFAQMGMGRGMGKGMMQADPPADLVVSLPKNTMATMRQVGFSHNKHSHFNCKYCHHKHQRGETYKPCSAQGCHVNTSMNSGEGSFYAAFHSSSRNSCVGCHRGASHQQMQHGPVACSGCHGDDSVPDDKGMPAQPEYTLDGGVIPPPVPLTFAEKEQAIGTDGCVVTQKSPTTSFPVDIDTGVYHVARSYLLQGLLPPRVSVTVEGMVNSLDLASTKPISPTAPFEIQTEIAPSPWNAEYPLLNITLRSPLTEQKDYKSANIVFLIDTSSSMFESNKLPLFLVGFNRFLDLLKDTDYVSIAVMNGKSGILLPPTPGNQKEKILSAIKKPAIKSEIPKGEGARIAYDLAKRHYIRGGTNSLVFVTDGDLGTEAHVFEKLYRYAKEGKRQGIELFVFEFGQLYTNDHFLYQLAHSGGGMFFHIEGIEESLNYLTYGLLMSHDPIAEGVKASVTFNPETVTGYHRLGAESLAEDTQGTQEEQPQSLLYPGQHITALYNLALEPGALQSKKPLCTVSVKYRLPGTNQERELTKELNADAFIPDVMKTSVDYRLTASMAALGILLHGNAMPKNVTFEQALELARSAFQEAPTSLREELMYLIWRSSWLSHQKDQVKNQK